jgi:hypothetical protein
MLTGEAESYPRYRALYSTLEKERALENQPVSENEINSLASHLLGDEIYSGSLKQWIRDRRFNRDHGQIPAKARLLYDAVEKLLKYQTTL